MAYEVWAEYEGEAPEEVAKFESKKDAETVREEYANKSNVLRAWVKEVPKNTASSTDKHWFYR
jgi:hypothetical protein